MASGGRTKVAILGGGVGALSAAFALSELDPAGERFEITLYQLGWRLGGKTASGRNAAFGQRIEEHGLHIWAGFYDNAFTILRAALKALGRPPGTPQATIAEAFLRQNEIFFADDAGGGWSAWPFWFQPDPDLETFPGRDSLFDPPVSPLVPLDELFWRMVDMLIVYLEQTHPRLKADLPVRARAIFTALHPDLKSHLAAAAPRVAPLARGPLLWLSHLAQSVAKGVLSGIEGLAEQALADALEALLSLVTREILRGGHGADERRGLEMTNFGLRCLIGCLRHDCLRRGLSAIDHLEFRDFLAEAGDEAPVSESALVRGLYDYTFAYRHGEVPMMSATTAIEGLRRLFAGYRGAFFWKATAGMGDTICTPIYLLLKQRGVRFRFFHRVTALRLDPSRTLVSEIDVDEQVALAEGVADYDPLVPVKGLPCWPSEPNWEQLKDGAKLHKKGVDFEDVVDPLPEPAARHVLRLGEDFDRVVLGIPVGALKDICQPLIAARPEWAAMVTRIETARTMAFQLWLDCDYEALGGSFVKKPRATPGHVGEPMGPIVTGYAKPYDTWSDMWQLLDAEDWSAPGPKCVAYFCTTMADSAAPDHQAAANAAARALAIGWMKESLADLWPNFWSDPALGWSCLHAPAGVEGEARFDSQFWQANVNPGERYALSLPGTLRYRLWPGQSGFSNLFLAGDWTRVPDINAGCVEVAAMSGILAASALSGVAIPLDGIDSATLPPPAASVPQAFVTYGGWVSLPPPPSVCRECRFHGWALKADHATAQAFLDRSINAVAGRSRFRLLLDAAFLMLLSTERLSPADPPFSLEGTMRESDMGLWLLVARHEGDDVLPSGVGWLPVGMIVDNPYAAASGREIWGFPKYVGTVEAPLAPASAGPFVARAEVIRHFSPQSRAEPVDVFRVEGQDVRAIGAGAAPLETLRTLAAVASPRHLDALAAHAGRHPFLPGVGMAAPVFFLKQFRSADSRSASCYQKRLEGAFTLDRVTDVDLLEGDWTIHIADTDSLPFLRDLGLGIPVGGALKIRARHALVAGLDFTVGPASPLS